MLALLLPLAGDDSVSMEIASLATLALGFIFVGSGNGEIASTVLQTFMERDEKQLEEKWARYMALGLALVFLGTLISPFSMEQDDNRLYSTIGVQDGSDATVATLQAIEHPISKQAEILVEMCSFAGTGNVLKVQTLLHHCDEHIDKTKDEKDKKEEKKEEKKDEKPAQDDTFQAFAVLGIALVAMGEDIGSEMALRQFNHLVSAPSTCAFTPKTILIELISIDALWRTCHS